MLEIFSSHRNSQANSFFSWLVPYWTIYYGEEAWG